MVVMLAATLSGCRLAKKDEDGTGKGKHCMVLMQL